jgi:signal transduction histidine kinase
MTYFNSRDIAAIALCAALWGVLNSIFSPMVFSITHLPLLCDLIGFTILTVAAWWIRKFGAITSIGLIATIINFALNPQAITFLGFTAAAFVFDLTAALTGFNNFFKKAFNTAIIAIIISTLSAAIAGFIIGAFFMTGPALSLWGGVAGWAGLHAVGGVIGGTIGASLVTSLNSRKIVVNGQMGHKQKSSASGDSSR